MLRPEATSMRLTDEGVLVEGSRGYVILKKEADEITATPVGQRSKKAPGYVERVREESIERARQHKVSSTTHHDGSVQINDHLAFYEATFNPTLRCLEMIQQWLTK